MSNHARRGTRRRRLTPAERYRADRYKDHRKYSAAQVRQILVDDGVARADTPLTWFVQGISYIATMERTDRDTVFTQINDTVQERCGLPLPITGLTL